MNTLVLIGKQASEGTVATSFLKLDAREAGISAKVNSVSSQALSGSRFVKDGFISRIEVGGDVPFEMRRDTFLMVAEGAGFNFIDNVADKIGKAKDSLDTFFTVVVWDKENNAHSIYKDCWFDLSIQATKDDYILGTMNVIAKDVEEVNSDFAGTIVDSTENTLICLNASISINGTDRTALISSASLEISNGIEAEFPINSQKATELSSSDATATAKIDFNKYNKAEYLSAYNAMIANNSATLKFIFGTGTTGEEIEIDVPKCKISDLTRSFTDKGSLSQSYNCFYDEVEETPIKITIKGINP